MVLQMISFCFVCSRILRPISHNLKITFAVPYMLSKKYSSSLNMSPRVKDDSIIDSDINQQQKSKKSPSKRSKSNSKKSSEYTLHSPSAEQTAIIDAVAHFDYNLRVDAVAGSGKTTTALHIANTYKDRNFLLLTYNARLKEETRLKRDILNISNLEVHSFHAFAVKYYSAWDARTDEGITKLLTSNESPSHAFRFDHIVIDEIQDMTPELFSFICKIVADQREINNSLNFTFIVFGDERQNIFEFKNADARYLTLAHDVFQPLNGKPWKRLELRTTFRLTRNLCDFLNINAVHFPLFHSEKQVGEKILYYRGDVTDCSKAVGQYLVKLLQAGTYSISDIFILTPSLKLGSADKETALNELANYLQTEGHPYYVPTLDDAKLSKNAMKNKILISTIHQAKGLERKVVVMFSASRDYFDFIAKDDPPHVCPNPIYVAFTRASELLILIGESHENGQLPFLTNDTVNLQGATYLEFKNISELDYERTGPIPDKSKVTVTRLTKYLSETCASLAMQFIHRKVLSSSTLEKNIVLKQEISTSKDLMEEVYDLNGLAIPAVFERTTTGKDSSIQKKALEIFQRTKMGSFIEELSKSYDTSDIAAHLRIAALYCYANSGFSNKPVQISDYNWITPYDMEMCNRVLSRYLDRNTEYEVEIETQLKFPGTKTEKLVTVSGRMDAMTKEEIWELKCTSSIGREHMLQLALYAWLYQHENSTLTEKVPRMSKTQKRNSKRPPMPPRRFCILNILTGEVQELTSSFDELNNVATILIENYLKKVKKTTDEQFLEQVTKLRLPYLATAPQPEQHETTTVIDISAPPKHAVRGKRTKKMKSLPDE